MSTSSLSVLIAFFIFLLAAVITRPIAKATQVPHPILLILTGLLLHSTQELVPLPLGALTTKEFAHDIILMVLLPTLVFETAYNMDISKLNANRLPIFVLALPGVLISTFIVALLVALLTPLDVSLALLLGAILSATDPSAVISAFRQLGAPKDLIMLIEGESLFNDATAITLTKILVAVFTIGGTLGSALLYGCHLFLLTLIGGIASGWILARILLRLWKKMPDDPFLEISLSLLLAFGSYLFAEEILNASGIVATTTAGLTLAMNVPLPISRNSQQYLNHFWSYLSFIATASVFLIVGLWMDLSLIWENAGISLVVLIILWVSRALIAYLLLPQVGRIQRQDKAIPIEYQHLVFVGGMRGAVTMALAMGLVTLLGDETLLSIAINVVFFSTLIQGLLIKPLTSHLCLREQDINDNIATAEITLSALRQGRQALEPLLRTELSTRQAPKTLSDRIEPLIKQQEKQLHHWFSAEVGPIGLWNRLMLRCSSVEIGYLYQLFDQGLISATVYEELKNSLDEQMEAIRHEYTRPGFSLLPREMSSLLHKIHTFIYKQPHRLVEQEYEMALARMISCNSVLSELKLWAEEEQIPNAVAESVEKIWQGWLTSSEEKIRVLESQHPDIAKKVQSKLLENYLLTAEYEQLEQYTRQYLLSEDDAEKIKAALKSQIK
ncbi:sodium/hydrogen exchanger [Photobacterium marinum]|uniref:Sodium/hydrogen exchanger n=1 Tax=Photobacterium marinum TaxID=1056511 RepID=L8JB41_9GAMM|nr:sodium:proton antiporter [Photobacterium marinum]ELR66080.1 sodium/hydrogen exchanger [Photobacterium marinum]